jgi:hypothetical protein
VSCVVLRLRFAIRGAKIGIECCVSCEDGRAHVLFRISQVLRNMVRSACRIVTLDIIRSINGSISGYTSKCKSIGSFEVGVLVGIRPSNGDFELIARLTSIDSIVFGQRTSP